MRKHIHALTMCSYSARLKVSPKLLDRDPDSLAGDAMAINMG